MAEETGSDFAWVNLGNVRDVIPAGTILARTIWNILPVRQRRRDRKIQRQPAAAEGA